MNRPASRAMHHSQQQGILTLYNPKNYQEKLENHAKVGVVGIRVIKTHKVDEVIKVASVVVKWSKVINHLFKNA